MCTVDERQLLVLSGTVSVVSLTLFYEYFTLSTETLYGWLLNVVLFITLISLTLTMDVPIFKERQAHLVSFA